MSQEALHIDDQHEIPGWYLTFEYMRASGPGGQHVNTSDTAVRLRFPVNDCHTLPDRAKRRLHQRFHGDINKDGELLVTSQAQRSRAANVDDAREKLAEMVRWSLQKPKRRKRTKPTKGSIRRRLKGKKIRGEKKELRGRLRSREDV